MIDQNPITYAKHLASYIRDPSTIRARTLEQFGRAPSMKRIIYWRSEVERLHAKPSARFMDEQFDEDRRVKVEPRIVHHFTPPVFAEPVAAPAPPWQSSFLSARDVVNVVARSFDFTGDDIRGPSRLGDIVRVRHLIAALLVKRGNSTPLVGRWINRDHTTVMHALRVLPATIARHPVIGEAYRFYLDEWGIEPSLPETHAPVPRPKLGWKAKRARQRRVIAAYQKGLSSRAVALKFEMSDSHVRAIVREAGVARPVGRRA